MILTELELIERSKAIRILFSDVDGILTDGRLVYGTDQIETKEFNCTRWIGGQTVAWLWISIRIDYGEAVRGSDETCIRAKRRSFDSKAAAQIASDYRDDQTAWTVFGRSMLHRG